WGRGTVVVALRLRRSGADSITRVRGVDVGMPEELRHGENDDALEDARPDERRAEPVLPQNVGNHRDEQRRAASESSGSDADSEPALLAKPFQRRSDCAAVHQRRAYAGET